MRGCALAFQDFEQTSQPASWLAGQLGDNAQVVLLRGQQEVTALTTFPTDTVNVDEPVILKSLQDTTSWSKDRIIEGGGSCSVLPLLFLCFQSSPK